MSRMIVTVLIFIAIAAIMIFGYTNINTCSNKFNVFYNNAKDFIQNNEIEKAQNCVIKMSELIENEHKTLMMIIDHDIVEKLQTKLKRTQIFLSSNEKSFASAELAEAKGIIDAIKGSQELALENIF